MKALKRRVQRGFTLFEALIVMAVGAFGIVGVAALADYAWDRAEYTRISTSVPPVLISLSDWLTRYHRGDCDGAGGITATERYTSNLGAAITAHGNTKFTANPPAADADRPCLLMWRHFGRAMDFNATLATPDTLEIADRRVGVLVTPTATDAAAMKALVAEQNGTATVEACDNSAGVLAMAIPVRSLEVCDDLVPVMEDHRRLDEVFCHEYTEAPAAVDGDAVMGFCFA